MAKTRAQMVTEICDVVGKSVSATSRSGAELQDRVVDYLNWGQKRIARFHSFHELNTYNESAATVTSVKRYPLSTGTNNLGLVRAKDISSIRLIDSENSRNLVRWHYRKFDKYYPRPENYSEGRPRIYARWGDDLEFFRIPDAAYTLYIRYSQWAQDLTSATQTSDFQNKDQLLITAGILESYLALQEYNDVRVWLPIFIGQINDAKAAEGDIDWEPEAEPHGEPPAYRSGQPWLDPYGGTEDPLYGYAE